METINSFTSFVWRWSTLPFRLFYRFVFFCLLLFLYPVLLTFRFLNLLFAPIRTLTTGQRRDWIAPKQIVGRLTDDSRQPARQRQSKMDPRRLGVRRRRPAGSLEEDDDAIMIGGAGAEAIDLDLSLNPIPDPGLPPLSQREPVQRRRQRAMLEEPVGGEGEEARQLPGRARGSPGAEFFRDESPFKEEYSDGSDGSGANFPLPETLGSDEIDGAIILAIEARRTHVFLQKLYWFTVLLLGTVCVFFVRIDFKQKWRKEKIAGDLEMTKILEAVFGLLLVATIAFRSDFPFNISILIASSIYAGFILGIVFTRHSIEIEDEE